MPGGKVSNASENISFSASFMHLKLRRKFREDYMEVGESKARIGLHDI